MVDKAVVCPQCGNRTQFDEIVGGACYGNRYYLNEDGSEVVNVRNKRYFEVDEIRFVCSSCEYNLDGEDGEAVLKERLLSLYSKMLEKERKVRQAEAVCMTLVEKKIEELEAEREGWQKKYREAEEGRFDVLGRERARDVIAESISVVSDNIFLLNEILEKARSGYKVFDEAKEDEGGEE